MAPNTYQDTSFTVLQWKKSLLYCAKKLNAENPLCLYVFFNVYKEFELGGIEEVMDIKLWNFLALPVNNMQEIRDRKKRHWPPPVQCPVSTPSLKMLRSIWSLSFKVSACQQPATDTRPENPQHYIWSLIKIVNEFFARSDVKQEMYQIRIICLFVVTEGSNSNQSNTTPLTKLWLSA